jgi:hypothetical protein
MSPPLVGNPTGCRNTARATENAEGKARQTRGLPVDGVWSSLEPPIDNLRVTFVRQIDLRFNLTLEIELIQATKN